MQTSLPRQLLAALAPDSTQSQASYSKEVEAMAKQHGFRNAEEMMLWQKQRSQPHESSVQGKPKPDDGVEPTPRRTNEVDESFITKILRAFESVNGK